MVVKKKYRQFTCVIVDHSNGRVLDVLDPPKADEKACVVEWLKAARESGLLGSLEEVTIDLWEAYANAVTEVFGSGVRVTIDRFHVMRNFQDGLSDARRDPPQADLPKEAAKELKGTRWLWLTNPENLTPEQQAKLTALKERFPALARLSEHREALRRIFDDPAIHPPDEGRSLLAAWCERGRQLGLAALEKFNPPIGGLERWMNEIANYFASRSSNGRTEGFNHGIRSFYGVPTA